VSRLIVPLGGLGVLLVLSFTLIVVVVARPWADPNNSWRTHLNLTEEPLAPDYTRSVQTFVSPEGNAPIEVWRRADCGAEADLTSGVRSAGGASSPCGGAQDVEWVVHGCAGCHGLYGAGSVVGPDVREIDPEKVAENVRFGPSGMPAFAVSELTDDHIALISAYLREMRITGTGGPLLSTLATPTPTATPRSAATQAATPPPTDASDSDVLALGKLVYEETAGTDGCDYCHGKDGRGEGEAGQSAPDIRGASRTMVRQAMNGTPDMSDIKLTAEELIAVLQYLQYLNQQP
jgi:mono/diheme cytochrome c family protein